MRFKDHAEGNCETHKFSVLAMQNFIQVMQGQVVPVDQQLDSIMRAQIAENRLKIKSIMKTVILCGQNNIRLEENG